jgi:hypothetical protein
MSWDLSSNNFNFLIQVIIRSSFFFINLILAFLSYFLSWLWVIWFSPSRFASESLFIIKSKWVKLMKYDKYWINLIKCFYIGTFTNRCKTKSRNKWFLFSFLCTHRKQISMHYAAVIKTSHFIDREVTNSLPFEILLWWHLDPCFGRVEKFKCMFATLSC